MSALGSPHHPRLSVRVFLEKRRSGEVWVPYKTFVGFRRGPRLVVGDRSESLYDTREFDSRDAALSAAADRVRAMIEGKFPDYANQDVDWEVVEEGFAPSRAPRGPVGSPS